MAHTAPFAIAAEETEGIPALEKPSVLSRWLLLIFDVVPFLLQRRALNAASTMESPQVLHRFASGRTIINGLLALRHNAIRASKSLVLI